MVTYFFDYAALSVQNTIEKWIKDSIILFPPKCDFVFTKNYRAIMLAAAAKVHYVLLPKYILPEIEKNLRRNEKNVFL